MRIGWKSICALPYIRTCVLIDWIIFSYTCECICVLIYCNIHVLMYACVGELMCWIIYVSKYGCIWYPHTELYIWMYLGIHLLKYLCTFVWICCKNLQTTISKKWSHRRKRGETQTILERMESNVLKWCGHVVRMEDSRWPKIIMHWSLGGRRARRRPEVKWGKVTERVMKQGNLTCDDAINGHVWRLKTSNRWTPENWQIGVWLYLRKLIIHLCINASVCLCSS